MSRARRRQHRLGPAAILAAVTGLAAAVTGATAPASRSTPPMDPAADGARASLPTVLVSRQLAESEQLTVGDTVELSAHASGDAPRTFQIAGIYEPMPDPLRFTDRRLEARLHLPDLQALTADPSDPASAESVAAVNVALHDPSSGPARARAISSRVPGLVARATSGDDTRSNPFVVLERFHLAIAIVTIVGSATFLLALMVMLAEERRETVGTLRLIGLTRGRVLRQVFAEGLLIALAGAVAGVLFARATEDLFNAFFQWRYDTSLVFVRITPRVAGQSVALAVPLGVAASVVASWSLLRRGTLELVRR
jgi:putative ABC transport system permease protein